MVPVPPRGQPCGGGPVEFERVVQASGNLQVARRQFWLGPHRSGMTVTFWAGTDVIHLTIGGSWVKSLRSHLGSQCAAAGEILAGRQIGIRIEDKTLMFFDPGTRELLRTRPSPLSWDQARRLRGARPAGPPPRPSAEPVTVQHVASNTGIIMVTGQKITLGRIHARQVVTVHAVADSLTIDLASDDIRTVRRTTTQPVRSIKAQQHRVS